MTGPTTNRRFDHERHYSMVSCCCCLPWLLLRLLLGLLFLFLLLLARHVIKRCSAVQAKDAYKSSQIPEIHIPQNVRKVAQPAVQADLFSCFGASFEEKNADSSNVVPKDDPMSRKLAHLNRQHMQNAPGEYQCIPKAYKIAEMYQAIPMTSVIFAA